MSPGHDEFSTTEILESGPPRRRRRIPRPVLFTAVAALTVTAGAGVAAATTIDTPGPETPTPTATASTAPAPSETQAPAPSQSPAPAPSESRSAGPDRDWRYRRHGGWGSRWFRPFGGTLHGEFVVPGDQEGQWRTVAVQVGEVTAVDQDSVTVRSEDGYTREYAVTSETRINSDQGIGAIQVGHQVAVTAEVQGGTATARAILDKDLRPSRGFRHHRHGGGPRWFGRDEDRPHSSPPSPEATPSATTTA
ncbi:MAG: hypothetical protein DIU60_016760 [Actinomycetes bacterium]|jgi:hypothetical protein|nr:MAG: hypothetical protein DIU60_05855 [Actinomycetota bacterium]